MRRECYIPCVVTAAFPARRNILKLGVLAAFVFAAFFVRAESAHAAFAWTGESATTVNRSLTCASAGGPCFYINVIVHGNGKVTSTAAENGMRVECPPANGFNCTTDPWFNWVDFGNPGLIEFTATPSGGATFLGWGNQSTGENGCPPDDLEQFPDRIHQPSLTVCRIWQLDAVGNDGLCLEAYFSTGSQVVGPPNGCGNVPSAPKGSPVSVTKLGTGAVNGTVTSSPGGINCGTGPNCGASFLYEPLPATVVTLTATVGPNTTFQGWGGTINDQPGGTVCPGTGPCTWTMAGSMQYQITATFTSTSPPPPPPPPVFDSPLFKKPPKSTRSKTAAFFWGGKRNGAFISGFKSQCRFDKAKTWTTCKSGKTYKKLKPGSHTFRLRVGNGSVWDKTPTVYTWKVKK